MAGETFRLIRVFVSSPGDVQEERQVLDEVVASINHTDGDALGFRLELFRWEDNVVPQSGPSPQKVVDSQTPVYDIYIGIMSTRFGTPTGRYGSGTEKEFKDALKNWKKAGKPWIAFYFDDAPKSLTEPEEIEQYLKVSQFRKQIAKRGISSVYDGVRGRKDGFYEKLSVHLRNAVRLLEVQAQTRSRPLDDQRASKTASDPAAPTKPIVPSAYTEWLRGRCGDVELMGLELKHGSGVRLNHVYTPLATSSRVDDQQAVMRPRREQEMPDQRESVQLLLDLLNKQSLYVSGDPGTGKSTFCRWVTWLTCHGSIPPLDVPSPDGYQETFPEQLGGRLPVLVPLRDFWQLLPAAGAQSLAFAELEKALRQWVVSQKYPGLDWPCLAAHLERGSAPLMLDGVDEVPPVQESDTGQWYPRDMLITGLAEAVARWTQARNRVLITSRPYGLDSEQQRKLGLTNAPILSLDEELQSLLVRRWFIRLKDHRQFGLETAAAMLNHIRVERGLHDLAVNPLLLTAMCIIYDDGKRLPHDKYLLYDRIVDTVLHKRYRGKENIETIRGRLAAVALGMHTGEAVGRQRETPEASASEREIDLTLQAYRKQDGSTDQGLSDTVHVREDLLSQSGLLVNRGDGSASFYHLSIQEFLAAQRLFILHGQKQDQLARVFYDRGQMVPWRNTLGLLFGNLVDTFKPHSGVACLRELSQRLELPEVEPARRGQSGGVWNQTVLFGDGLQILVGRESAIPADLRCFFEQCVDRAVKQEIAVHDRQTLAVTLGRLGDPRIEADLRIAACGDEHPGYVEIPPGTYVVGDERRKITIDESYCLSKYPVTNSQYALFIRDGGYSRREWWSEEGWAWVQKETIGAPPHLQKQDFNAPNQPVVTVSWWEADASCRWAGGQLPSEQQWEAAARGPDAFKYPWGDDWEDGICNSREAKLGGTSAVGIFPRSRSAAFELDDMAGNVWQWCADQWAPDASSRVVRGGCWWLVAGDCRAAFRDWFVPVRPPVRRPGLPCGRSSARRSRQQKPVSGGTNGAGGAAE